MITSEWNQVAELIHDSTNAWYAGRGLPAIFNDGPGSTLLFCEVYESLDPGCCFVAEDCRTGRLAGSCFYHPRSTHVSLGIMNVHPDCFGKGIARLLLQNVIDFSDERGLPTRLVSSAMNLDSYSLYNRAGFVPQAVFQDLLIAVPEAGLPGEPPPLADRVREATADDIPAMVALERELVGLEREKDFRFFIENRDGVWHSSVIESPEQGLTGFLSSIRHPASNMVGPGVMRTESEAIALIHAELKSHRGNQAVVLTPAAAIGVVHSLYDWGARNCELHLSQVRGERGNAKPRMEGIVIPTFMPETG